ncbi:hypothetical protein C0W35_09730 [Photobacterium kishitanii]|uniref:YagK/YfjJ domain-containing protein n=1 Tax=Photobacterium kishitanii TaxID=318456 RepID=UPI000D17D5B8|nr:inovirus-type Gp2 protein [Photobacterium kishitanii]PSU93973.1 hypothetical protein C0W35_09730 [Photobacterium kishitanii]
MPLLSPHEKFKHIAYYQYKDTVWLVFNKYDGIIDNIQDAICREVFYMINKHSRVRTILFNLHVNNYSNDNSIISKFMKSYIKRLERKYNTKIGFIWVREQINADKQHYHIAIFIDAKKCPNAWSTRTIAQEVWQTIQKSGTISFVHNCLYSMFRNDMTSIQTVILRLSYYAKNYSKTLRETTTKRFHTSNHT